MPHKPISDDHAPFGLAVVDPETGYSLLLDAELQFLDFTEEGRADLYAARNQLEQVLMKNARKVFYDQE